MGDEAPLAQTEEAEAEALSEIDAVVGRNGVN